MFFFKWYWSINRKVNLTSDCWEYFQRMKSTEYCKKTYLKVLNTMEMLRVCISRGQVSKKKPNKLVNSSNFQLHLFWYGLAILNACCNVCIIVVTDVVIMSLVCIILKGRYANVVYIMILSWNALLKWRRDEKKKDNMWLFPFNKLSLKTCIGNCYTCVSCASMP